MSLLAFSASDLNPLTWARETWFALVAIAVVVAVIGAVAPLRASVGRALRERSFVGVAVVLAVAAGSLAIVIQ
jgi:hypothetical protein